MRTIEDGGLKAQALAHKVYKGNVRLWSAHVGWMYKKDRWRPTTINDKRASVLEKRQESLFVNRRASAARSTWTRHATALGVVHAWLYKPGTVLPILRGDVDAQWLEIVNVIRRLPPWMLPDGFEFGGEHHDDHVIVNPANGTIITRPSMSLAEFIQQGAWQVLEASVQLDWNWHIDKLCEGAEMVSRGDVRKLAINVPPGSMKSLTYAVFWAAWEWTFNPTMTFFCGAHSQGLSRRDSEKFGTLVTSPWYNERFGKVVGEVSAATERVRNSRGGDRRITSPTSGGTGWRADRLLVDDLISVSNAYSQKVREHGNKWFLEEFSNRMNDRKRSAVVIIAQRTHELDVFSKLANKGYSWIIFPTRYSPGRFAEDEEDPRNFLFEDDRIEDGEFLHESRFGAEEDEEERLNLGPVGYSCQHDQKPTPDGGGLVSYAWMEHEWNSVPTLDGLWVQVWDLRNSGDPHKDSTSYACGQLWFKPHSEARAYLIDVIREKWDYPTTEACILSLASDPLWGRASATVIEDKADGRAILRVLDKKIAGLVPYNPGTKNKAMRWRAVLSYWKAGNVLLPPRNFHDCQGWIDEFKKEHYLGTGSRHNDQLDTSAMALHYLFTAHEVDDDPWKGWFD